MFDFVVWSRLRLISRRRWAAVCAAYVLFSLGVIAPLWARRVDPIWDAFDYFYPAFSYLASALRDGHLPLWDPYTNCGLPFHAEPQSATLNPIALLLAALVPRASYAFVIFWVVHWLLAGIGMIVLARALRATPAGALVAALAYSFSGFFVGHAEHTSWVVTAAWMPCAVGLAHLAVARGEWAFALLAGAAMALGALGGYPVLVAFGVFALGLWLAFAFLGPSARFEGETPALSRRIWRILATIVTVGVVLFLVWSPILQAFAREASAYTDRAGPLPGDVAFTSDPFTLRAGISLLFPYVTTALIGWFPSDISMNDAYLGILAIPLAAVAFTSRRPRGRLHWLMLFAVFMFVASLGGRNAFQVALHQAIPPMQYMRHNAGYRLFWILPLAAAAGVGFSLLMSSARARARMRSAFIVTSALAVVIGLFVIRVMHSRSVPMDMTLVVRLYLPTAAVLVVAALVLWRGGDRRRPTALLLVALLAIDLAIHVWTSATVWSARGPTRRAERLTKNSDPAVARGAGPPAFEQFNEQQVTRFPVARGYVTMKSSGFNDVLVHGRFLEVLMQHRFWLTESASLSTDTKSEIANIASLGVGDPIPVFVDRQDLTLPGTPSIPGALGAVTIESYAPERIELLVDVPGLRPAMLASTERYTPGWRVQIDGIRIEALRTNFFFRGVIVPPGRHVVQWRYEPAGWKPLVTLAAFAFAISIVGAMILLRRGLTASAQPSVAKRGRTASEHLPD